jgi:peptidoglycan/LPS O-acetylase OafA/YrhL
MPMAFLVFFLMIRERRLRIRPPRWMVAIGDASYSIYLSHVLVLSALGRLWSAFRSPGLLANMAGLALLAAGTIAAGLASYAWLEKPWHAKARALPFLRSRSSQPALGRASEGWTGSGTGSGSGTEEKPG